MRILIPVIFIASMTTSSTAKEIQFGTIDYCPLVCKQSDKLPGVMIEVAKKIFSGSKYKLNLNYMSLKRATADSSQSIIDGFILGSKVHFKNNFFPKNPTLSQPIVFFTHKNSKWKYRNIDSLKNINIAAIENFNYINKEINSYLKESKNVIWLNEEDGHKRAFELLKRGRIQAFLGGSFSTQYKAKINGSLKAIKVSSNPIGHYDNYISLNSKINKMDRAKILNLIDTKTIELKRSGELKKIYSNYGIR